MGLLLVVANPPVFREAAGHLAGASSVEPPGGPVPGLGDGDSEEALGAFHAAVQAHTTALSRYAGQASRSLANRAVAFERAGDG